ncbi:MAG: hypothetical protein IJ877_04995 [Candidatus Gastranaerophilales bacterium]|nr:hypothetical protein [Candidatus Gastranaerophilales bacterium]
MKFAIRTIKNQFHPLKIDDNANIKQGEYIIVRTDKGEEVFRAFIVNEQIQRLWEKHKPEALPVVRVMTPEDFKTYEEQKELEVKAFYKCRDLALKRGLVMKFAQARYTFDRKKITFYYTAPERVDFRELLKDLTKEFPRVRIDLRHIGVRDETSIIQGQGICGQDYCCCRFLKKFEQVNTKLARDQGIPITPGKITGACGRLLCCLNYEYKNYIDAAKTLPPVGSGVMTPDGVGRVFMVNFLKKSVNVKLEDGKIKEYQKPDIEMIDGEVNIDIDINNNMNYQEEEVVDIKSLEDEKNSSTGNI